MSGATQGVGNTLTGGIQDVSAILPLLGTDQCEEHVGSALDSGFLYAAAAPLSIFGSLGIVKVGFSVLVSSMSIPKISWSMNFSGERWLGARTLDNAGFKPAGTVAALIAMDGTRYKAETRLMQILEEKHIDNPENLSIEWKSRDWNVRLILSTIIAAVLSGIPYIALLLQNSQPSLVHTPWIYPLLRTVGSCLAAVFCQFLIQSRVISHMKNRIVFMTMNRVLVGNLKSMYRNPELALVHEEHLRWDADLPSEQCLWSLERFLPPKRLSTQRSDVPNEPAGHASITIEAPCSDRESIRDTLQRLHNKHFPTPAFERVFVLISWLILCLSLFATVVGYIGCFTLVSNSRKNGPLIWLGLEAALSIMRIVVWAWNPSWDEKTNITVKLELTNDPPLVTTEKEVRAIKSTGDNTLALVPERRFLEWITPYTGPLEPFRSPENLTLYFTLTTNGPERKRLYMTLFDFTKRIAVTLHREEEGFKYVDADVVCNRIASEMEARLQLAIDMKHPWRINDAILFDDLEKYYKSIMYALSSMHPDLMATLKLRWNLDLLQQPKSQNSSWVLAAPSPHDQLYLQQGYEHHLKTNLIKNWAKWIVQGMGTLRRDARNDCHCALKDSTFKEAKWELTELDSQLAWEWTRRELSLFFSSIKLEGILRQRMKECMSRIATERRSKQLGEWMVSEFVIGQRKRLEKEREQTKQRMEKEMKDASECAEIEGRPWRDQGVFTPQWRAGLHFIDRLWSAGIEIRHLTLESLGCELDTLVEERVQTSTRSIDRTRFHVVRKVGQRFEHWHRQRENEQYEMDATIKRISLAEPSKHLGNIYQYPQRDPAAALRFVELNDKESLAKVCSATVYDVRDCNQSLIFNVIEKSTTRSVINMHPDFLDSIPENDHLLYISSSSGKEPAFIQRNRDRWWDQQMGNSSMFYFSPESMLENCVSSSKATVAHIFIFLESPSSLRLRLLHYQILSVSVSIQENGTQLRGISTDEIPRKLQLKDFVLEEFAQGKHELELVVDSKDPKALYCLRDILIEFLDGDHSPVDKDGNNLATMISVGM